LEGCHVSPTTIINALRAAVDDAANPINIADVRK
jgi:hypothetical protein